MNFVSLPAGQLPDAPADAQQFGTRPEHLRFCATGEGLLDGTIAFNEALGAENLIHVELTGDGGSSVIVRVNANAPAPALGDKTGVTAEPEHFFFFDKNGQRLPTA